MEPGVRFFRKYAFDIVDKYCREAINGRRLKYHRQSQHRFRDIRGAVRIFKYK
jgi:hypothetical protein